MLNPARASNRVDCNEHFTGIFRHHRSWLCIVLVLTELLSMKMIVA